MIALPLQTVIFFLALAAFGIGILAAAATHRYHSRDPLLIRSGVDSGMLAELFDSAPFGLLLLDDRFQTIHANVYARRLLPSNHSLESPESAAWRLELQNDLAAEQLLDVNQPLYRMLTLPNGKTISWWICPLPRLILILITDLTYQRQLQKISQTFLSTLSHELRTPLTAVLAHLDIVQKQEVDEQTRAHSLTIIQQEMNRLARLVQDMLRLGNLEMSEQIEKRPLDLLLVVEAAVAEVILLAEAKNISISLETAGALPRVLGDADKLKQAMLNMLDNSIKFSRSGDRIQICLAAETVGVRVTVSDTGPGIPAEHLPRVTERFYRIAVNGIGKGLGLAIVAEILRLHDTQLEIKSINEGDETGVSIAFLLPA